MDSRLLYLLSMDVRPAWAIACPALTAVLIWCSKRRPNLREAWTLVGGIVLFLTVRSMTPAVLSHQELHIAWLPLLPGIDFALQADALGMVFAITSSSLWILVSLFSIGYMRTLKEHAQTRYFFCFALALVGALGIALAGNLLTMFIFYEILTLSTYPLVAHTETPEAISAGHKYLAYLLAAGAFFLIGILMVYHLTGTTDFRQQGILQTAMDNTSRWTLQVIFFCFLLGFAKAAWMPVHAWLPSAMVAPTPVSALLHAVAVVKAGVFGIIRIVCHVYGVELTEALNLGLLLAAIAAATMIAANAFAIGQRNLKRMLAYSTINQLSLILLGVALLSPAALTGAILHIPFHGFMKITLFLCAGAIIAITDKNDITEMTGLGRIMPITSIAFFIGALGMCGAPPLAGFLSKWHIAYGAVEAGLALFLVVVLIGSLLDVVYFFPVLRTFFLHRRPGSTNPDTQDTTGVTNRFSIEKGIEYTNIRHLLMVIPLLVTALFAILFCLFPNILGIYELARLAADTVFGGLQP